MKYVSIDIETTGLDPDMHQVLQIGAVIDDTEKPDVPIDSLPSFDAAIHHPIYQGDAFALGMNGTLLTKIAKSQIPVAIPEQAWEDFCHWLEINGYDLDETKIVAAGKNFASFDRQFLRRLWPKFSGIVHHRSLDPAMFFLSSEDSFPPSTEVCRLRAATEPRQAHDALADARTVCDLIRVGWRSV